MRDRESDDEIEEEEWRMTNEKLRDLGSREAGGSRGTRCACAVCRVLRT